jgi:farnesyl diphosphate synthase
MSTSRSQPQEPAWPQGEAALQNALAERGAAVTEMLDALLPAVGGPRGRVVEAMRYSALGGGKRLRPFLVCESARLFDVPGDRALRVAAAIEMVHCYSLIHDDLPAMDDSALRRGRPTAHVAFDEATAILAGDGLLTEAFAVLADTRTHRRAEVRVALVAALAAAAGAAGMVGGQMIDISPERGVLDLDGISHLQSLKTGALIRFSCEAGAILAEAGAAEHEALVNYALDLGLAFQIADDILDAESDAGGARKADGPGRRYGKSDLCRPAGHRGGPGKGHRPGAVRLCTA